MFRSMFRTRLVLGGNSPMSTPCRLRMWLLLISVVCWTLPARAADLDKLLPDDCNFVLSIHVKQILASPLFTKEHQKQVDVLLKMEAVQAVLKDTGFNPLKDVDRLMVILCPSSFAPEGES